jgi:hypothetical protein
MSVVDATDRYDSSDGDVAAPPVSAVGFWAAIQESVIGVFLLTLAAALVVRYSGLFVAVIDWDESLYAVMAEQWLAGGLPYDAVWDQHSVGLPALFALILAVFPKSILALRLSACIAVAIAATSLYFAARTIDRRPIVPLVVVTLYIGWTARLWGLAANTEIYLNALIAPAMVLLMREIVAPTDRRDSLARACVGGLLLGVALQIKHVAIAETALFLIALTAANVRRRGSLPLRLSTAAMGCLLLPSLLVIAYFHFHGLAGEYFRAVIEANFVYAVNRPPLSEILQDFPRSLILPVLVSAAGMVAVARRPDRLGVLLAAGALAAALDIALPGQFWPHYFLLRAPPAALLAGVVVARAPFKWTGIAVAVAAAAAVTLLLTNPVGIFKDAVKLHALETADAPRIVADRIGPQLAPDDSIFVLNYQPVVYLLSDAAPPTRHVLPADWSQRYRAVSGLDPIAELGTVFATQPKFVVFVNPDWLGMGDDVFAALRDRLAGAYEKDFEVIDRQLLPGPVPVQVYRRKDATAGG